MEPIESYLIPDAPPSMYYVHDFITKEEEASILQSVCFSPYICVPESCLRADGSWARSPKIDGYHFRTAVSKPYPLG